MQVLSIFPRRRHRSLRRGIAAVGDATRWQFRLSKRSAAATLTQDIIQQPARAAMEVDPKEQKPDDSLPPSVDVLWRSDVFALFVKLNKGIAAALDDQPTVAALDVVKL
jgi:hypothetical protein